MPALALTNVFGDHPDPSRLEQLGDDGEPQCMQLWWLHSDALRVVAYLFPDGRLSGGLLLLGPMGGAEMVWPLREVAA